LKDDNEFLIHLNKENLWTEGRELIKKFLLIIQTYKSSGCIERASAFYAKYSEVTGKFLNIRDIVIDKKKPRRIELNNNLVRYNEQIIEPLHYPESFEGIIHSYADRFPFNQEFRDQIVNEWNKTKHFLRV
jgi:dipeptidyl-peptidase-3